MDAAPHLWDDQPTSGTGTSSTHDRTNAKVLLGVSASTAGTRVRQTYRRFNYQPGKSQLVMMTFVMGAASTGITRRVGYFDDFNGFLLEQTASGPAFVLRKNGLAAETFAQADWNMDRLDGTGPSGITLDLSKAQIMFIDFEWLGVGTVHFGFILGHHMVRVHDAHHSNQSTDVYTSSPNLPLRYELASSGAGAAATLSCICSTVISEGGIINTGYPRAVSRGTNPFATGNDANLYAVLGLRLTTSGTHATVSPTGLSAACTSNAALRCSLVVNPTINGAGAISWVPIPNSAVEYAAATTNTNTCVSGTEVMAAYAIASTSLANIGMTGFFGLGMSIGGRRDELWLCAQRLTGAGETIYASLNFIAQS
jgi:hypothetical protein